MSPKFFRSAAAFAVNLRQHERDGDAAKFGRLQREPADIDPAAGAHAHVAKHHHAHERQDEQPVDDQGLLCQGAVVDHQARRHRQECDGQCVELRPELWSWPIEAGPEIPGD
jgi:hypothetical protein